MVSDEQIRAAVRRARREVIEDIRKGVVPETASDVNDLQDYTDANMYGGICDDDGPQFSVPEGTIVLAYLDAWMEAGRPNGLPPVSEYLRGHLAEQKREVDEQLASTKFTSNSVPTRVSLDQETWFPAVHDPTDRWNGWASPRFDRETAEQLVPWVNQYVGDNAYESEVLSWDGDDVVGWCQMYADEEGEKYGAARWSPGRDGRYSIGAWAWTWTSEDQWGVTTHDGVYVWAASRRPLTLDEKATIDEAR